MLATAMVFILEKTAKHFSEIETNKPSSLDNFFLLDTMWTLKTISNKSCFDARKHLLQFDTIPLCFSPHAPYTVSSLQKIIAPLLFTLNEMVEDKKKTVMLTAFHEYSCIYISNANISTNYVELLKTSFKEPSLDSLSVHPIETESVENVEIVLSEEIKKHMFSVKKCLETFYSLVLSMNSSKTRDEWLKKKTDILSPFNDYDLLSLLFFRALTGVSRSKMYSLNEEKKVYASLFSVTDKNRIKKECVLSVLRKKYESVFLKLKTLRIEYHR